MTYKNMGDFPKLPDELRKDVPLNEKILADIPKRTGLIKKVRHKVNEILAGLTK